MADAKRAPQATGTKTLKAFLRWVGGKRNLVSRLKPLLPQDAKHLQYHEPFVGAGSLFFSVNPTYATLSDLNRHLIDCYRNIRDHHEDVAAYLVGHAKKNSEAYYYRIRKIYNRSNSSPAQAARFIYLNRTGFNGVFRVNTHGNYNVPYGDKPNPVFPSRSDLQLISGALKNASLRVSGYEKSLALAAKGNLVYLDPPYPPLNGTSFFTHYTRDRFDFENQERLAEHVKKASKRGALFIMTNADLPKIRALYKDFTVVQLRVTRYVSCKGTRYRVGELVILNYEPAASLEK